MLWWLELVLVLDLWCCWVVLLPVPGSFGAGSLVLLGCWGGAASGGSEEGREGDSEP